MWRKSNSTRMSQSPTPAGKDSPISRITTGAAKAMRTCYSTVRASSTSTSYRTLNPRSKENLIGVSEWASASKKFLAHSTWAESCYSAYTFSIINIRSVRVLLTVLAVGTLTVLVADETLVVALAVLLSAACLLAITSLPRKLAAEGHIGLHHHLVDGFSSNLAELKCVLAAFAVAVDAKWPWVMMNVPLAKHSQ